MGPMKMIALRMLGSKEKSGHRIRILFPSLIILQRTACSSLSRNSFSRLIGLAEETSVLSPIESANVIDLETGKVWMGGRSFAGALKR